MTTTAQKLKIKEGYTLRTIHAPESFLEDLSPLPQGVSVSEKTKDYQQLHWFVRDKAQMENDQESVMDLLKGDTICWIYFPKGTSGIQTDLTRDKGWDALSQQDLQMITLISFNDTWSAFGMRRKTEADKKKEAGPKERPIFQYIDAATKTINLPEDFALALDNRPKEKAFFHTLSFSNKKEYVEWIVNAKRDETRVTRVKESIERLGKGWKNPANR